MCTMRWMRGQARRDSGKRPHATRKPPRAAAARTWQPSRYTRETISYARVPDALKDVLVPRAMTSRALFAHEMP